MVLLSASDERVGVSRMRDFYLLTFPCLSAHALYLFLFFIYFFYIYAHIAFYPFMDRWIDEWIDGYNDGIIDEWTEKSLC